MYLWAYMCRFTDGGFLGVSGNFDTIDTGVMNNQDYHLNGVISDVTATDTYT